MKSSLGTLSENNSMEKKKLHQSTIEIYFMYIRNFCLQQVVVKMGSHQVIHNIQISLRTTAL